MGPQTLQNFILIAQLNNTIRSFWTAFSWYIFGVVSRVISSCSTCYLHLLHVLFPVVSRAISSCFTCYFQLFHVLSLVVSRVISSCFTCYFYLFHVLFPCFSRVISSCFTCLTFGLTFGSVWLLPCSSLGPNALSNNFAFLWYATYL